MVQNTAQNRQLSSAVDVGARLIRVRARLDISQTDFAVQAGIGRERLASYESGRVPLPWGVGVKICATHKINPGWLAEGIGPWRPWVDLAKHDLPERSSFVKAYASIATRHTVQTTLSIAAAVQFGGLFAHSLSELNPSKQSEAFAGALEALQMLYDVLPTRIRVDFIREFELFVADYVSRMIEEFKSAHKAAGGAVLSTSEILLGAATVLPTERAKHTRAKNARM